MSAENVEAVRLLLDDFQTRGELQGERFAPTFVWDMSTFRDWPEQKFYDGVEGLRAFLGDWTAVFGGWELRLDAFYDAGEKVAVVGVQRGRASASGGPSIEAPFGLVYTLGDGLVLRCEAYADPAEALEAAGLEK